jgi:hypothetical protein
VHPVAIHVDPDTTRPRLLVLFRFPLVVPHLIWLVLWSVFVLAAAIVAWVVALATGRVPRVLHRFMASFVRAVAHVVAFLALVGRPFPGFLGREGSYPIDLTIGPPVRQSRLTVLARLLLAVPAGLLATAYGGVALVAAVLGWCAALVTGRIPAGLRDIGAASLRYHAQLGAYVLLVTPRYPDSSPALVPRPVDELAAATT